MLKMMRAAESMLERTLPPLAFCHFQETLRPAMDRRLRNGLTRRVSREGETFRIDWSDGSHFYFQHQRRYARYMMLKGASAVKAEMLAKYQDERAFIPTGGVVVEAGANAGEFTVAAAEIASRIYTFDPDPNIMASLKANTAHLANVQIEQAALGDHDGEVTFFLNHAGADSSMIEPDEGWTDKTTVRMVSLATFLESKGIETVDFFKVEAEGAEPEILAGTDFSRIKRIAVDCGPERHGQPTFVECEAILHKAGFTTWRRDGRYHILFGENAALI